MSIFQQKKVVVGIILYLVYKIIKQMGPEADYIIPARGKVNESESVLLSRIEYATEAKKSMISRYLLVSLVIILIVYTVFINFFPTIREILTLLLPLFFILFAQYRFFNHHSDKFDRAYIHENVQFLRRKLRKSGIKIKKDKIGIDTANIIKIKKESLRYLGF